MKAPLLVLATSGPAAEVGLVRGGLPDPALTVEPLGEGALRGRGLLPAVARLLAACGLDARALGAVLVDVGPGSFTGVRVGVTAAKTLAFALGLPVVAVDALEALAGAAPEPGPVLALRDAGRGTVYAGLYGPPAPGGRAVLRAPERVALAALGAWPPATPVGEEVERLAAAAGRGPGACRLAAGAAAVLGVGGPRLLAGGTTAPASLVPLYLQASAPERLRAGEVGATSPGADGAGGRAGRG